MRKKGSFGISDAVPFIAFAVIFIFFSVMSQGRLLSAYSLNKLVDQSIVIIVIGCGVLFVVSQGSIDLSVGVNLALSGVVGLWAALLVGAPFLLIPFTMIVGTIVGIFNGFIVSKLKVPSFILTIAMLIGVRGVVLLIQSKIDAQYIPASMQILNNPYVKIPMFAVIVLIMFYLFEFTKAGRYSQAIGENEIVAKFVGVPITKMKILAYALSGLMAGLASVFSIITIGGTSQQMGSFMEMRVAMAVYLGGVLVSGGKSAKFYKMLLGAFSITIIVNGLAIIGYPETQMSQSVGGVLLLLILFITTMVTLRSRNSGSNVSGEIAESGEQENEKGLRH